MKTNKQILEFYDKLVCASMMLGWHHSTEYREIQSWCIYNGVMPKQFMHCMDIYNGEADEAEDWEHVK